MTGVVQTDLGPPPAGKYKEEPVDDPVSKFSFAMPYIVQGQPSFIRHGQRSTPSFLKCPFLGF